MTTRYQRFYVADRRRRSAPVHTLVALDIETGHFETWADQRTARDAPHAGTGAGEVWLFWLNSVPAGD